MESHFKTGAMAVALLSAMVLVGCSNKQDANDKNFGVAVGQYLEKNGDLCLQPGFKMMGKKWPVDLSQMDLSMERTMPTGMAGEMAALVAVGLASGTDIEVDQISWLGKPTGNKIKVKRYALTDAGKKFYQERHGDICYGQMSLDKIVKWDMPKNSGGPSETTVTFLYKIDGLADWAGNSAIQAAFPNVANVINGAGKAEQGLVVKLTNQGWESLM